MKEKYGREKKSMVARQLEQDCSADTLTHMALARSQGSDDPKSDSYFKAGNKGEYSNRVENTYKDRAKQTKSGNPPSDNPYPLPQKETK